ncbi:hypothetical protein BB987_00270 [Photorhabdus temperata]|nr:hypothetical protein BB987_00270 [Photorhabdus temperata]
MIRPFNAQDMDTILDIWLSASLIAHKFIVSPPAQGRGIGKQLINYAKNLRNKLELEVYCQNKNAIGFYLSCGFVKKGEAIDKNTNNPALFMEYIHT